MSKRWVVNASPLIILGKVSHIDILPQLCDELIIPGGVVTEVMRGPEKDNAKRWLKEKGEVYIKEIGPIDVKIASWDLGLGESEVISYCVSHPQYTAIIDDWAAKKCASTFSLKAKGTLAILTMAKRANLVTEVKPILERMIENGFRVKSKLYMRILATVNED